LRATDRQAPHYFLGDEPAARRALEREMQIGERAEPRQPFAHRLARRGSDPTPRHLAAGGVDERVRDLPTT
jgi:hypothetical protein